MRHILGHDRSQLLLLPEAVDDYVAVDNPVRFIEAFVDGLDLAVLGFIGTVAKATGRPGYAPADLLKLYIYGYLNRTRSSRRLEAETHRNIEVIWLLRHLKPDFKTIADFRRQPQCLPSCVSSVCAALSPTGSVWPGVAGGGWNTHQGGQQQGSQFHAGVVDPVHQSR